METKTSVYFNGFELNPTKPCFKEFFKEFVFRSMFIVGNSSWVFLWSIIVHVCGSIFRYFWRFSGEKSVENVSVLDDFCGETDEISVENEGERFVCESTEEKGIPKLECEVCNASTSKYQFFTGNSVCAFIEEPQTLNFTIHEMFAVSHGGSSPVKESFEKEGNVLDAGFRRFSIDFDDDSFSLDLGGGSCSLELDDCGELSGKNEVVIQGKTESSVSNLGLDEQEVFNFIEDEMFEKEDTVDQSDEIVGKNEFSDEVQVHSSMSNGDDLGVDSCSYEHDDYGELKQGKTESSVCDPGFEEQELFSFDEVERCEKEEVMVDQSDEIIGEKESSDEVHARPSISDSDDFWATIHKYDCFLGSIDKFDCDIDEFFCHMSSAEALEPKTPIGIGDIRVDYDHDQYSPSSTDESPIDHINSELDHVNIETEHQGVESRYLKLEPRSHCSSNDVEEQHLSGGVNSDSEDSELDEESMKVSDLKDLDDSETRDGEEEEEEEEEVGSDVVLEQRELIRQMKKEVRQLKISGLPTILEESESSRVEDDLRPLRIDERIGHKDRMDEIQTFYKRYLDKMRKLDTLSQQTMYAIGLLQLKNQEVVALNKKVSVPVIKSLLAQNFWSNKLRKHDPVQKLIRELQRDLELVYVGQLCLSWEMLKWQHHKAEELQAHDPDGFRQHNHVAGEFQKFQVLLRRFTEDEPYHQGPRVQHYVKSRCNLLSLLQVPLVKDDPWSERRRNEEDGISVKMLKEVIGASMRSFWDFLHADKDEAYALPLMGSHGVHVDLQDPSDADLLTEIRSSLQKKEKRLKDLVKSGNCLVKKFKKHQDQKLSHETLVAQVELRLVSRVLSMPKLSTNQLLWCHKKLNRIDIIGRKIYLEYSFLLFPC